MKLYSYHLKPQSPWGTPLRSDTLYGLILWQIAEWDGESACKAAIAAFEANDPPFLLSSAMPRGYLPLPCLPSVKRGSFASIAQKYFGGEKGEDQQTVIFRALQAFKKFRKSAWLPIRLWQEVAGKLSMEQLFSAHQEKAGSKAECPADMGQESFEPHVNIDRQTQTASSGQLFFNRLRYFDPKTRLTILARTNEPEFLKKWLAKIGKQGFGKDASTGNGRFAVEEYREEKELDYLPGANRQLLLSTFAAKDMKNLQGWYKCESRSCKTGPGMGSPFKDPFLSINEGAVLADLPAGPYILRDIHPDNRVVQVLAPLTLPCAVAEGGE